MKCVIKREPFWNTDKCPNVEVRNGMICAFERKKPRKEEGLVSCATNCRGRKNKGEQRKEGVNVSDTEEVTAKEKSK